MKIIILLFFISLLSSGCIAKTDNYQKYTGDDVKLKFNLIQDFTVDYEVENGGPVFENEVKVYKFDNSKCIIVSRIDGDSGVYGTEGILFFSKDKVLNGYRRNYSYSFLNGEGSTKLDKLNYNDSPESIEKNELNKSFMEYSNSFDNKTLKECR